MSPKLPRNSRVPGTPVSPELRNSYPELELGKQIANRIAEGGESFEASTEALLGAAGWSKGQASESALSPRRRRDAPTTPKPRIISAHVPGSGTATILPAKVSLARTTPPTRTNQVLENS